MDNREAGEPFDLEADVDAILSDALKDFIDRQQEEKERERKRP